jgi:hypothetical protein
VPRGEIGNEKRKRRELQERERRAKREREERRIAGRR